MSVPCLLRELCDLPPMAVKESEQFKSLVALNPDRADHLAAIPTTHQHSISSLYTLRHLLEELPGPWPVFQLIKTYTRLYSQLPDDAKTNSNHELSSLIERTSTLVKSSYTSFAQFIGCDGKPALRAPTDEDVITHRELRHFVDNFQLPVNALNKRPVVSIALQNGPLLAATCTAVTTYYTASPINPAAGVEQFRAEILQARADFILTTKDESSSWTGLEMRASESIQCFPCAVDYTKLASYIQNIAPDLDIFCLPSNHDRSPEAVLAPKAAGAIDTNIISDIRHQLVSIIDNYMIPSEIHIMPHPFQKDSFEHIDVEVLHAELEQLQMASMNELAASTEGLVTKAFAEVLSLSPADIPRDSDFFSIGGDSLRAGRLLSMLRTEFSISLPITAVFNGGTVTSIAAHIDKMLDSKAEQSDQPSAVVGCTETCSSTNPFLMILQLFPLVIFYPLRRAVQWTIFFVTLAHSQKLPTNHSLPGRFLNLTVSMLIARIIMGFVSPIVGIICKWLIMGRYREGLYPMWGMYHTRWWLVQKIVAICGKGFFDANEMTERIYCRLMGAKVGKNVKLEGAAIGEWDLIEIGDDCNLTKCICRPFAAEGNTSMYLGRITIGSNCSVGMTSIIAPGTTMPPGTCLGFNSSSWEMQDASEEYRDQLPSEKPKPHWVLNLLFTMPLKLIGLFLSAVPWMAGLIGMVTTQGQKVNHKAPLRSSVDWFTQPNRIAYHYLALALGCLFGPFFLFGLVILVKSTLDCFFGKLKANSRSTVDIWRANLIKTLLPEGKLHRMTSLFGQHYEATSIALRMLGAKIGERVYWPGTGPSIGDYHLIDVGNDVVFGSRSHLVTFDGIGSEKVTIQGRAMIADRVYLLPGVAVGERTTMGSGALTKRNGNYVSDGTYVGSKAGDAVCLSTGSDTKVSRSHMRNMQSEDTLTNEKKFNDEKDRPDTQPSITSGSDTEGSDGTGDWAQHLSPFGRAFTSS
ncbi:coenzyme a synthetase [Fusarium phyllophilum]|uniref:Coenzyme a synthetase n=1 Tax=Fusarium phyllophilum TaxID=47803 RepID=A0A8H5K314_9HYPO|nr:coenzyme a synthetase [Fusarium phyllophilum]